MRYLCCRESSGASDLSIADVAKTAGNEIVVRFLDGRGSIRIFDPKVERLGSMLVIKGRENTPDGWGPISLIALESVTLEEEKSG